MNGAADEQRQTVAWNGKRVAALRGRHRPDGLAD